jgi:hypothetical protein
VISDIPSSLYIPHFSLRKGKVVTANDGGRTDQCGTLRDKRQYPLYTGFHFTCLTVPCCLESVNATVANAVLGCRHSAYMETLARWSLWRCYVKDRDERYAEQPCQVAAVVPEGSRKNGGWDCLRMVGSSCMSFYN